MWKKVMCAWHVATWKISVPQMFVEGSLFKYYRNNSMCSLKPHKTGTFFYCRNTKTGT